MQPTQALEVRLPIDQLNEMGDYLLERMKPMITEIVTTAITRPIPMNKKQLCEHFKKSNNTIDGWIREGLPYLVINNSILYDPIDVWIWIDKHKKNMENIA
ncbi:MULTISPECIES: hypothetical protein [unclassified Enterococcus]|uniref:hypothetical protein n=1 Tax=unclassified Enterococcus TaxID=2608891 RepID=UPI001CE20895|nr:MULTISPECIES: hypothetical protein [unclassified Enterococcus]MCA5014389.1 hypothetical protein [Enterococcus sp. S23]MCA5017498.1 hypothetical protein [Enterococcus sp. S22(2020)]